MAANDHGFTPGPKRKVTNLGKAGRAVGKMPKRSNQ